MKDEPLTKKPRAKRSWFENKDLEIIEEIDWVLTDEERRFLKKVNLIKKLNYNRDGSHASLALFCTLLFKEKSIGQIVKTNKLGKTKFRKTSIKRTIKSLNASIEIIRREGNILSLDLSDFLFNYKFISEKKEQFLLESKLINNPFHRLYCLRNTIFSESMKEYNNLKKFEEVVYKKLQENPSEIYILFSMKFDTEKYELLDFDNLMSEIDFKNSMTESKMRNQHKELEEIKVEFLKEKKAWCEKFSFADERWLEKNKNDYLILLSKFIDLHYKK